MEISANSVTCEYSLTTSVCHGHLNRGYSSVLVGTTWPHVECPVYSPMLTSNSTGASMALTIVAFMNAQCSLNFLLLWNFCTLYTSSLRISSTGTSGRSPKRVSNWTNTLPLYATPSPYENSTKIYRRILFRSFTINEKEWCQRMLFLPPATVVAER